MIYRSELAYDYPQDLIALSPQYPSRVLFNHSRPTEIVWSQFLEQFQPGDVFVRNKTKVIKRRVFGTLPGGQTLEVLFLEPLNQTDWLVLCPASKVELLTTIQFPDSITGELIEKGRIQKIRMNGLLTNSYFFKNGEVPLPPYIQKARGERHARQQDASEYQSVWAEIEGSSAAPTASLHFKENDIQFLKQKGVLIEDCVLHVGLGTYLPVTADKLSDHDMHNEQVSVPYQTWESIQRAQEKGHRIWALGTTVVRALESVAAGLLPKTGFGFEGSTSLYILPGFQFQVVNCMMTNFHQPESTLLAMVCAFAGKEKVFKAYQWAIENRFRLFSYGDLTVWAKSEIGLIS